MRVSNIEYPIDSTCPCCLAPRNSPAPLISRSLIAMCHPEPSSVNRWIDSSRLRASGLMPVHPAGWMR
ncbi:MAG: hypothetical protein BWX47_00467 [candidate division Hyd24-12 bacterium ADurb.Bin004]|nr:MAG: hypothetical protein BWX47_00467 [candidate division Hyd24-12 bacterium ADurb.Bin004]